MIKNMNSKMTTNSQLSTTEPKKQKKTEPTTRRGTESQMWRSHGGLSAGRGKGENGGKVAGIKKHNWQAQNRQGEGKNSIGRREAKELACMTHGCELKGGIARGKGGTGQRGAKRNKNQDNCNSIIDKYIFLKKQIYFNKKYDVFPRVFKALVWKGLWRSAQTLSKPTKSR